MGFLGPVLAQFVLAQVQEEKGGEEAAEKENRIRRTPLLPDAPCYLDRWAAGDALACILPTPAFLPALQQHATQCTAGAPFYSQHYLFYCSKWQQHLLFAAAWPQ